MRQVDRSSVLWCVATLWQLVCFAYGTDILEMGLGGGGEGCSGLVMRRSGHVWTREVEIVYLILFSLCIVSTPCLSFASHTFPCVPCSSYFSCRFPVKPLLGTHLQARPPIFSGHYFRSLPLAVFDTCTTK